MELVEHIAAERYEGGVLVLRGGVDDDYESVHLLSIHLLGEAKARGTRAPLIVNLAGGQSLEAFDEDAMRAAGWVRNEVAE